MKNIIDGISNWWSPQPIVEQVSEQCGDIFKQMGFSYNSPAFIKSICCPFEQQFGVYGASTALLAATVAGGYFVYRGGPQYLWNKVRSKTAAELMMVGIETALYVKYGPQYGALLSQLVEPITSNLNKILPDVTEHKKQQKRHDILKKLNGLNKTQKESSIKKYDSPEQQKMIEESINEELVSNIKNYLRTFGERFSNGSQEDKNIIIDGLKDFLLYNKTPSFNAKNNANTTITYKKL